MASQLSINKCVVVGQTHAKRKSEKITKMKKCVDKREKFICIDRGKEEENKEEIKVEWIDK